MNNDWMVISKAANALGVSLGHVRDMVRRNELTACCFLSTPGKRSMTRRCIYILRSDFENLSQWVSLDEAGKILDLHRNSVRYRMLTDGLEHRTIGRHICIRKSDVEASQSRRAVRHVPPYQHSPSIEQAAYLAGFIDGEGAIDITKIRRPRGGVQYGLRLSAFNCNTAALEWILQHFGGLISARKIEPNRTPAYVWSCNGVTAGYVLAVVLPFLLIKKHQAELALEFQDRIQSYSGGLWNPLTADEIEWRERQKALISANRQRMSG